MDEEAGAEAGLKGKREKGMAELGDHELSDLSCSQPHVTAALHELIHQACAGRQAHFVMPCMASPRRSLLSFTADLQNSAGYRNLRCALELVLLQSI